MSLREILEKSKGKTFSPEVDQKRKKLEQDVKWAEEKLEELQKKLDINLLLRVMELLNDLVEVAEKEGWTDILPKIRALRDKAYKLFDMWWEERMKLLVERGIVI